MNNFQLYFLLSFIGLLCLSCNDTLSENTPANEEDLLWKNYILDEDGRIISTQMVVSDFDSALACQSCHPDHYEEWSSSMHAYSMRDPVFFSGWLNEQSNHPDTGERFCIQCHSPVAFVTGTYMDGMNLSEFQSSDLPLVIKEGISCDVCHSITSLSSSVHTTESVAAVAEYFLYPGEDIKFSTIESPAENLFHESQFSSRHRQSEVCLPCHNMTVRGVDAEMTFSEWNDIPQFAMAGLFPCQSCHMQEKENGYHNHEFAGVDVDLTYPKGESPQFESTYWLLQNALTVEFGFPGLTLADSLSAGDSLFIPITVTSLTGHSIPSGTSFAREAWLEIKVEDAQSQEIIYSSGLLENDYDPLDLSDPDLLLFTSYLLNENSDTTHSVSESHGIINHLLPGLAKRYHSYQLTGLPDSLSQLIINIRMLFRPFKPEILNDNDESLLLNLPVFTMADTTTNIIIMD